MNTLLPAMISWAEQDEQISQVRGSIQAMTFDPGSPRFFVEWYEERRTEYVLSRILTNTELLGQFIADHTGKLSSEQELLLRGLLDKPAFWVYASQLLSYDFPLSRMHVEDFCPHEITVYHELINSEEIRVLPYRLLLVFDNGDFYQSLGYQHAFANIYADDIFYFFTGLIGGGVHGSHLTASVGRPELTLQQITEGINRHYLDFLKLDIAAFHSEIAINDEYLELVYEEYDLPHPFDRAALHGRWKENRKGPVIVLTYLGPDQQMALWEKPSSIEFEDTEYEDVWDFPSYVEARLVVDTSKNRLAVFTNTEHSWKILLYLACDVIGMLSHEKLNPDYIVSLPILGVTTQIEDFLQPWYRWNGKAPPSLQKAFADLMDLALTRSVLNEAIEAEEFDLRFDLDARCKRVLLEPEIIRSLLETVKLAQSQHDKGPAFSLSTIEGDFELHDFPPLTPQQIRQLADTLTECSLFEIRSREAYPIFVALTNDLYCDSIDAETLPESIEDLFYVFFDDIEQVPLLMMNYLFLLFLHTKQRWVPVRTFGVELLKLLYPYLQTMGDDDTDAFISRFSDFVYTRLRNRAVVDVQMRPTADQRFWGTYEIRPTQFFTAFVKKK